MSNAARPRYPKPRPRRARPGFVLLLALLLGLTAWFGLRLIPQGENSPATALTATAPTRAAGPESGSQSQAQTAPGKGAHAGSDQRQGANSSSDAATAKEGVRPPRAAATTGSSPVAVPGAGAPRAGLPPAQDPPPFADLSPGRIAAHLAREYQGVHPLAWGERMEGITSSLPVGPQGEEAPVLALTLDACGGKKGMSHDADLIAFLREHSIPATIFVTSLWMRANPEALADLAGDPLFEIAGHGTQHRPCSVNGKSVYGIKGTASFDELLAEVEGNARDIEKATGRRPRWFRSGTAYYDDIAVQVIHRLGLRIAGYSIAGDEGATLPPAKVAAKTLAARHGDILLLHMNKPRGGTRQGLELALPVLLERGARFVRLSDVSVADAAGTVSQ